MYNKEISMLVAGLIGWPIIIIMTLNNPRNKEQGVKSRVSILMFFSVALTGYFGTLISIICQNLIACIIFINIFLFSIFGIKPLCWLLYHFERLLVKLKIFPPEWVPTIEETRAFHDKQKILAQKGKEQKNKKKM